MADNDQVDIFATDQTPQSKDATGGADDANNQQVPETFEWSGRQLTAQELHDEARKLQQDYTVKTGRLSELEKSLPSQTKFEVDPVLSELKEKYGVVTKDELETVKSQLMEEATSKVRRELSFEETLKSGENTFNGANGGPKFERASVLNEMNNPNDPLYGKVFDPIIWFKLKNEDKIKQANINELSNARNSNPNDLNGSSTGGVPTKPAGEKTFGQMNAEEMIEQFKNVNMTF